MRGFKSIFSIVLAVLFLSSIQSFADTFVVTNLNDPGAGSLRQAIINSNLNPGPDEIVFEEGLEGTIFLNVGPMSIRDDLTIDGGGRITIDAGAKSNILDMNDGDDEKNRIVNINGLRFINGIAGGGGAFSNNENLTVDSCQFFNGNASFAGGAIDNTRFLTVNSCLFENNSADFGGAISNEGQALNLIIRNSEFVNNQASFGGAIRNDGIIELITNSIFTDNSASLFDFSAGGAIQNFLGTIKEISHSTFNGNTTTGQGGAIVNLQGGIETIFNSTFTDNSANNGGGIWNDGVINISFTTIANNKPPPPPTPPPPVEAQDLRSLEMEQGGIVTVGNGVTRVRNSILASNVPDNCFGFLNDFGGNYSDDFSCGLFGDGSSIILGPLADNGGPTETMDLIGGDPVDGATVNCDALNEMGNPTGIPIGIDQRYFPRPFGLRCDSGAFESQPTASVTITKVTDPSGGSDFRFGSSGFNPFQDCPLDGGGDGMFALNDGDSITCIVPQGDYSIKENIPQGYELLIICLEAPDNIVINNETGEIDFTIVDSSSDVDCIYTNVKIEDGGGGGGCSLAPAGASNSIPLYLFIPVLILIRRIVKRQRS